MTRNDIRNTLKSIFKDVFDGQDVEPVDELTANEVEGWNSVSHIDLICAVEDEFGIAFTTSEIAKLQNVGELLSVIESKMGS